MRIFAVFVDEDIGDKINGKIEQLYADHYYRLDKTFLS